MNTKIFDIYIYYILTSIGYSKTAGPVSILRNSFDIHFEQFYEILCYAIIRKENCIFSTPPPINSRSAEGGGD